MRTLNLTLEDREFARLEKSKDKLNENREKKLNWEKFILLMHEEFTEQ